MTQPNKATLKPVGEETMSRYCEYCCNTGSLDCHCGGDLCVCENNGEYPCPHCDGASDDDDSFDDEPPLHEWVQSQLGHGEVMCKRCTITNREAAALGELNWCRKP